MSTTALAAFDVGGTTVKSALVVDGGLSSIERIPTPGGAPGDGGALGDRAHAVVEAIVGAVEHARRTVDVRGVGVVVPGLVADGVGVHSENLGWRDAPFRDVLGRRLGVPVAVDHDVTAAALAEWSVGSLDGQLGTTAVVVLGTGVAATTLVDGEPLRSGGWAGELGHAPVPGSDAPCVCGSRGCLEAVAGAPAIVRRHRAAGASTVDVREVVAAMRDGDPHAAASWQEAIDALAAGIHQLAAICAPTRIVLAGGLADAGADLLEPLVDALDARIGSAVRRPELVLGRLGSDAGLVGAALAAGARLDPARLA